MRKIFEKYLKYRYELAGALTPGQQLEVVRRLRDEARSGKVPVSESTTVVLPVHDPRVQAVLRGEPIVAGAASTTSVSSANGGMMNAIRNAQEWPVWAKVLLMLAPLLLIVGAFIFLFSGSSAAASASEIAASEGETATLPSITPPALTSIAAGGSEETTAVAPTAMVLPTPTPTPTPTPLSVENLRPAESPLGVASLEILGMQILFSAGMPDEQGMWNPQGSEWLEGTMVRPVLAIPAEMLDVNSIQPGTPIVLRRRNGKVWTYHVDSVLLVKRSQIEAMYQDKPGLVVILVPSHPADSRTVILASPEFDIQPTPTPAPGSPLPRARVRQGPLRLRETPSLAARVLRGLQPGEVVQLKGAPIFEEGLMWVEVVTADGMTGWVAEEFLDMP